MAEHSVDFRPADRSQHVILVVDDDPVSRYTTVRWLQSAGFQTREAANGQAGLAAADSGISAMVLDVHLPDISGFELCRRLRSRAGTARLPVLHLSAAFVTDEDKVKGLDAGADAYLTHPVEPAVLVASVQALVRARVAEDASRRSSAQFEAIYARAPDGICLLDHDGRFIDANPAMLTFLGHAIEQVRGARLTALVPPEFVATAQALLTPVGTREARGRFPVATADGGRLALEWTVLPEIQPGVHMAIALDLTEHARLEEQRQQALQREREARADAERLGRMKDEFIAVLSHELRTPLTAIVGWVHILRKRTEDAAMRERGLEAIERNVALQSRLVSDLLDMSSINLGKMRLSLEPVDIADAVGGSVMAFRPAIEEKGLTVEVRAVPPLAPVHADRARLQQIIANLLGNAIKFSTRGGSIEIGIALADQGVRLSVRDHGKGIARDFLPRLFDRFSQADAGSNRRQGGLGLGLSIVRHLVDSHDGTVVVESDGPGHGAEFTIWLPLAGPKREHDAGPDAAGDPHDPESMLGGVRLLVVDDDPDICAMLQIILRDRGAEVQVAHDVDTALTLLEPPPHLLISDIGMPGRDGYSLIRELRRREAGQRHLPAIALTSYAREQDRRQALSEGFDAHCAKPVQPLQLVQTVRRLLSPAPAGS